MPAENPLNRQVNEETQQGLSPPREPDIVAPPAVARTAEVCHQYDHATDNLHSLYAQALQNVVPEETRHPWTMDRGTLWQHLVRAAAYSEHGKYNEKRPLFLKRLRRAQWSLVYLALYASLAFGLSIANLVLARRLSGDEEIIGIYYVTMSRLIVANLVFACIVVLVLSLNMSSGWSSLVHFRILKTAGILCVGNVVCAIGHAATALRVLVHLEEVASSLVRQELRLIAAFGFTIFVLSLACIAVVWCLGRELERWQSLHRFQGLYHNLYQSGKCWLCFKREEEK